jgi:hypothetical protein
MKSASVNLEKAPDEMKAKVRELLEEAKHW